MVPEYPTMLDTLQNLPGPLDNLANLIAHQSNLIIPANRQLIELTGTAINEYTRAPPVLNEFDLRLLHRLHYDLDRY